MVTKLFATMLFVLVLALPARAQQVSAQVTGSVVDSMGSPLAGLVVSVVGLGGKRDTRTAVTDRNGRFLVDGVPPGRYQVGVAGEHGSTSLQRVIPATGDSVEVRLELPLAFTSVTIADRNKQDDMSAPASVSVIGREDIAASAAKTVPDLLRAVPGVNVVQFSARELDINARSSTGILSNAMLVMVDGRSVVQPFYGNVHWDLVTVATDEIDQIEVLRSPSSALWGANALNGVINIQTKSPREIVGRRAPGASAQAASGDLAFGERGTKSAGVTWAEAKDRLSYRLSASYLEQDPWERDNRLPDGSPMPLGVVYENRGTQQPKFDARVDWGGDKGPVWSWRGGVSGAYGLTQSAIGPGEFAPGSYASYAEVDHSRDGLDLKFHWNRLEAPYQIVLFNLPEQATSDTYAFDVTRRLALGGLAEDNAPGEPAVPRHFLTFGGSLSVDRFDISIAPDDRGRVAGGVFLEDRVRVNRRLNVYVGGRFDKFDTADAAFAPRVSAVLRPALAHAFHVSYNRAYRAPTLLENFVNVALPSVVPTDPPFYYSQLTLGSTDLQMEKQDAFEVGYEGKLGSHARVSVTGYTQRIKNKIWFLPVSFYGPGAPPPGWPGDPSSVPVLAHVFSFVNLGSVRDRGLEVGGQAVRGRLSIQGAYTLEAVPLLDSGTTLPLQINQPPRHQGGVSLTYRGQRWTASGDVHYTGRAFWADVLTPPFWGHTNGYQSVNARVSYRLPSVPWELWLSGTNLLDEHIQGHVFGDTVRRRITAGVHWDWHR